jgi:hypothetical protein
MGKWAKKKKNLLAYPFYGIPYSDLKKKKVRIIQVVSVTIGNTYTISLPIRKIFGSYF